MNIRITDKVPFRNVASKIGWISILLIIFLATYFINPKSDGYPACYFHELTGYDCLTCGMGRSVYAFAHLNFLDSIAYHPVGFIAYLGLILLFIKLSFETLSRRGIDIGFKKGIIKKSIVVILISWFSYWGIYMVLNL